MGQFNILVRVKRTNQHIPPHRRRALHGEQKQMKMVSFALTKKTKIKTTKGSFTL